MKIERSILLEKNISTRKIRKALAPRSNVDAWRVYYCYQVGATFLSIGMLESTLIAAMAICDRIKVAAVLHEDASAFFDHIPARSKNLQSSTLGNLIGLLSKHNVPGTDLAYLRWVKRKRDYFVHQFCNGDIWPGDQPEGRLRILCRRLTYLEYIFLRCSGRVYRIMGRAGLMKVVDLGEDGHVAMNIGSLFADDALWSSNT